MKPYWLGGGVDRGAALPDSGYGGATTAWLENLLGSMIGVAVGAFVALFVLYRQLRQDRELFVQQSQNDRELFIQTLAADRDKEKRAQRRAVAVQLAAE